MGKYLTLSKTNSHHEIKTVVPAAPTPEHEFHLDAPLVPTVSTLSWAQENRIDVFDKLLLLKAERTVEKVCALEMT